MEARVETSGEIENLLGLKGRKRLKIKNDITNYFLKDHIVLPGIGVEFVTSEVKDGWNEYKVLISVSGNRDDLDNPRYLPYALSCLSSFFDDFNKKKFDIDSIGIQEVCCNIANHYYVLIYILQNEKQ